MALKMNLPLQQFLTLVGPAQKIVIVDEDFNEKNGDEPLYTGPAAKLRDKPELLAREVKLIEPRTTSGIGANFWIWIF